MNDEMRKDMAAKGFVYHLNTKNYPPHRGLRQLCRNIENEDYSKLFFDVDAYEAAGN